MRTQDFHNSIYDVIDQLKKLYNLNFDADRVINGLTFSPEASDHQKIIQILDVLGFGYDINSHEKIDPNLNHHAYIHRKKDGYELVKPSLDGRGDGGKEEKKQELILILSGPDDSASSHLDHIYQAHSLDWFWAPIKYFKRSYFEIILASIFINIFALTMPIYSLNVYDRVIINFAQETLTVMTIGVMLALGFDFLFKTIRIYILERLTENLSNNYDYKLMQRLLKIDQNHLPFTVGEQSNLFREMQSIREFYASKLVPTIIDVAFIIFFVFVIYLLSPVLVIIPCVIAVSILILNFLAHIPISRVTEEYFAATQKKTGFLVETINGMRTLKMFNADQNRLFHWGHSSSRASRVTRRNNFIISSISTFTFMLSQSSHILVIYFGVYQIQQENLTIGGLIACTILSSRVIAPILNLSGVLARLKQSKDLLVAIDKIFKYPHTSSGDVLKGSIGDVVGEIKLHNVSYRYPDNDLFVIKDLNLEIGANEKVGIIGPTAAGKTTLVKIISGLIKPSEGLISFDGRKYNNISENELRDCISFAPQDPFLFKGSILYNITLGRENLTKDNVEKALEFSGLSKVLQASSNGLDMQVAEGGQNLSGGQKQAISLARAIVSDPKILVFDEPTNGMDTALEGYIKNALKDYLVEKSFIMVTHRTSLLSLVDRLILVNDGSIVTDGARDDVLTQLSGGS